MSRNPFRCHHDHSGCLRGIPLLGVLGFILLLAAGCHNSGGSGTALQPGSNLIFKRVAIAPFQMTTPEQADINAIDCSRCGYFARPSGPVNNPESMIEHLFVEKLNANNKVEIVPSDRVAGIYERYTADYGKMTPLDLLKKVGNDLEVDGILFGYVYRYRDRQGMPYAASKPASVAYEIHLFRVSDSALVWKGRFDRTQTSLMENILHASTFVKGGGRWITAKELAESGIDDVVKTFPAQSK